MAYDLPDGFELVDDGSQPKAAPAAAPAAPMRAAPKAKAFDIPEGFELLPDQPATPPPLPPARPRGLDLPADPPLPMARPWAGDAPAPTPDPTPPAQPGVLSSLLTAAGGAASSVIDPLSQFGSSALKSTALGPDATPATEDPNAPQVPRPAPNPMTNVDHAALGKASDEFEKNIGGLDMAGAEKTVKAQQQALAAHNAAVDQLNKDFEAAKGIDRSTQAGVDAYNAAVTRAQARAAAIKSQYDDATKGLDLAGTAKTIDAYKQHYGTYQAARNAIAQKAIDDSKIEAPTLDAPPRPLEGVRDAVQKGFEQGQMIPMTPEQRAAHPWLKGAVDGLNEASGTAMGITRAVPALGAAILQGMGLSRDRTDMLERGANAYLDWGMTGNGFHQPHPGDFHEWSPEKPRAPGPENPNLAGVADTRAAPGGKTREERMAEQAAAGRESYESAPDKQGNRQTNTPTDPDIQEGLKNAAAARAAQEAERAGQRTAEDAAKAKAAADAEAARKAADGNADPAGAAPQPEAPTPPGDAPGGASAGMDTGKNMPEPPETLKAQQEQLVAGTRKAQMFPSGTDELPLPKGMERVETPRGVFHFDPSKITAEQIKTASDAGRENDILDLGPHSKADVDASAARGSPRVNVTERDPQGNEVKTATGTEETADAQAAHMEATKTPGNTVQKEPLDKTISERENGLLRGMGWSDKDIAKMPPSQRADQVREAMESGVAEAPPASAKNGEKPAPEKDNSQPASAVFSGKDAHGNDVVNFGGLSMQLHGSGFGGGQHIFVKLNGKEYSFDKERDGRKGGYTPDDLPNTTIPASLHPIIADFVNGKITRAEMVERLKGLEQTVNEAKKPGTREAPINATTAEHVDAAAANVAEPTPAQAEAGNYQKGHVVTEDGLPITIENPKGSVRKGVGEDGKPWETTMPAHYGYVKGTVGADGDHVDVYLGPGKANGKAFVVDQIDPKTGKLDEHKVILHVDSLEQAAALYHGGFSDGSGHSRMGAITETTTAHLKDWLANGKKGQPFGKLPEEHAIPERENLFDKDTDPSFLRQMKPDDQAAFAKGEEGRKDVAIKLGHAIDNLKAKDPNHPRIANLEAKLKGVLDTIMPNRDTARRPAAGNEQRPGNTTRDPGGMAEAARKATRAKESPEYADKQAKAFTDNGWSADESETFLRQQGHSPDFAKQVGRKVDKFWADALRKHEATERAEREKESPAYADELAQHHFKEGTNPDTILRGRGHNERFVQDVNRRVADLTVRKHVEDMSKEAMADPRGPQAWIDKARKNKVWHLSDIEKEIARLQAEKAAAEPKPKKGEKREIGQNRDGETVYEDHNGVRSVVRDGVRISEAVHIVPGKGFGVTPETRGPEHKLTTEMGDEPASASGPVADMISRARKGEPLTDTERAFLNENALASGSREAWKTGKGLNVTDKGRRLLDNGGEELDQHDSDWGKFSAAAEGSVEKPKARPRTWDTPVSKIEESSKPGMHPHARRLAILRAWVTNLSDADFQRLAGWQLYDFPRVLSDTMEPGRLLEAFQRSLKEGQPVHVDEGPYTETLDRTAAELLGEKPAKVDSAATEGVNEPKTGKGETNADDGAGVRPDAPGVSGAEQPAVAGEPPELGGADGTLGADRPAGGGTVRDAARPDDDQQKPAAGVRGKGKGARGDTGDGGRDRETPDRVSAAAEAGRVEAEKTLADRARRNYVIDPESGIGDGGAKAKVRGNLDAIRVVKELLEQQREPTVEEKDKLARYVGWGAFAQKLFDPDRHSRAADEWKTERSDLRSLLTDQEYAAARASTLNAHFTSVPVIQGMWKAAEALGYRGGRALEPSAGVGSFIGLTPESVRGKTAWTAVELDPITGHIAKALYGGADVNVKGFQDLVRPDNHFDLAISNVPFGSYGIRDTRYGRPDLLIHDYFFVKSLDKVRPGGMVAFVTSAGTMNKVGDRARMMIAERADLVGAIRLPGGKKGAFAGNAGTEVTTDILFLRKRAPGEKPSELNPWMGVKDVETKDGPTSINEYFAAHPEHVLGTHALTGTMYRKDSYAVEPFENSRPLGELIAEAAASFPTELHMVPRAAKTAEPKKQAIDTDDLGDGIKEGAYYEKGGKLFRRENGVGREATEIKAPDAKKVRALTGMRDLVNKLLTSQATGDVSGNDAVRKDLKKKYAAFVKEHGPINLETHTVTSRINSAGENVVISRMPNFNAFRGDPDAYKVAAIEDYDPETQTGRPAVIMDRDIVGAPVERRIEGPSDALAASLEAFGGVNEHHVANLLGIDAEKVEKALGDLVFRDPNGDKLVPSDEYLSGDVVQKLEEARALVGSDPRMARNVEALEKVQPTPLRSDEITAQFGAPWIPEDVYKHFIETELGGQRVTVKRQAMTAEWNIAAQGFAPDARAKFQTDRVPLEEVLKAALNLRRLSVFDAQPDGSRVLNAEATRLANVKLDELRDHFTGNDESGTEPWVWKDQERAARLGAIYNRQFNATVLRKFDGSHLTFPGMASTIAGSDGKPVPFSLRPHQKNAVWRALQRGNTLFDHVVGAGKTFTMIATGMEGRRLGLYRKPAYVVPNHMLEQFSREFLQAYPGAKLLVAQKDEMTKDVRRAFAAKTATGDWDGVVITHDAFGRINMGPEWQAAHIAKQVAQLEDLIREMKGDSAADKRTVKQIENAKIKLQARIQDLMNVERKDQGVTFEEMGIDHLFVDEAHLFKNLSFVTKMTRVKGLSQGNSQRAEDLYLKLKWLEQNKPGRSAVFATGTPISNTIAEMFTMQRYLQEPRLAQMGLDKFDSWASTFGQTQENTELSADGRSMKTVTSFSRFVNIPELVGMYAEIADTQTADMLNLPRPELARNERGERGVIAVKAYPSPEEEALINSFVERAANMKGPAVKGGDNMLKVVTDGRKVATDGRLYNPDLPFNPEGKIAKAVGNIMKHYTGAKAPGLAQLVFLDMGTPKAPKAAKPSKTPAADEFGFDGDDVDPAAETQRMNLYEDLRQRLVEAGIPRKEIAFIHEATDDRKKAAMFAKTRSGEIRVLVGSTGKMGVGTNVQRLLVAMHHIDAPYKPAEVEQRDGRGIRQGNMNPEISIYRYVTERSFDAFMWQKLDTKSRFIAQLKAGAKGVRTAEDIDNPLPEAAEMKAAASGDPRIMEEANLKRQVMRLETQRKSFTRTQQELDWRKKSVAAEIAQAKDALPHAEELASQIQDVAGDKFVIDLSGLGLKKPITDRAEAGEAVKQFFTTDASRFMGREGEVTLGSYGGMKLMAEAQRMWTDGGYSTRIRPFITSKSRSSGRFSARMTTFIDEASDLSSFTRQLDTMLRDVTMEPEHIKATIAKNTEDLGRLNAEKAGAVWPRETEYQDTVKKLKDLQAALKAKGEPQKKPEDLAAAGSLRRGGPRPEPAPRTLFDSFIHPTELTPEFMAHLPPALRHVAEIIQRVGGNHFNGLMFKRGMFDLDHGAISRGGGIGTKAMGAFTDGLRLIRHAWGTGAETEVAYHEPFHALERGGAFDDREMALLKAETPRMAKRVRKVYKMTPETEARTSGEEIRALAFGDYGASTDEDRAANVHGLHVGVRRIFNKTLNFLRRIDNARKGLGFQTYEDLFKKAYDGDIGRRAARGEAAGGDAGALARNLGIDSRYTDAARMPEDLAAGARRHPNGNPRHFADESYRERMSRKLATIKREGATYAKEQFQDYSQRMLDLQRGVEDIAGPQNQTKRFYDAKRLLQGKTKAQMDAYLESHIAPLIKVMKEEGLTRQDVAEYAFARHAPERNALMDARDPNNNGEGSGKSDQGARDMLNDMGPNMVAVMDARVQPLLDKIREFNLEHAVRGGILSREAADEWAQQMPNYVPLKGFEDASLMPDEHYFGEGRKMGVFGKESETAFGRNGTMAGDPFAALVHQSYRVIDRVERNRVGMTLWRGLRQLSDAQREQLGVKLDEGDSKKVIDPQTGLMKWVEKSPLADPERVVSLKIGGMPHHAIFKDARTARAINRMGADQLPIVFKQAKNTVDLAKSMWTHYNPDFVVRHFAMRYPVEAILNAGEHGPGAMVRALKGFPLAKPMRSIMLATKLDPAGRATLLAKFNAGQASEGERFQHYYLEARKAGAVMDFNALSDLDSLKKYMDRAVASLAKPGQRVDAARGQARAVHEAWNGVLQAMDNAHRLVAYVEARERGEDVTKAALAARDATVDFGMRGALANWVNLWWPFGNTAVQTSARMMAAGRRGGLASKFLAYSIGGSFAAGFMASMFNYMFGGNDENGTPYQELIPEYVRRLNMSVILPGTKDRNGEPYALTIALPYNYAMPYTLGQAAAWGFAKAAGYAHEPAGHIANMVLHSILEGTIGMPQEDSLLGKATPALALPFLHVAMNENFFGGPVHTPYPKDGIAHSYQGRPTTGEGWKMFAQDLNAATGGDRYHAGALDLYPEDAKEIFGFFTSAFARFGTKAFSGSIGDAASGKMPIPEETPFLDTLLKSSKTYGQARQTAYYDMRNELRSKAKAYDNAVKDGDAEGAQRLMETDGKEIAAHGELKQFESALRQINKARTQLRADKTTPDAERERISKELDAQTSSVQNQASKVLGGFLHQ